MKPRLLLVPIAAALLLAACSQGAAPHPAEKRLPPISAMFLGATDVPVVTTMQFMDAQNGWFGVDEVRDVHGQRVSYGAELMRTTDGGRNWTHATKAPAPILALDFLSPAHGFVLVGTGSTLTLLATSDGGKTLKEISHPSGGAEAPELRFTSPLQGFIASGGTLDVTVDGGSTWHATAMNLPAAPSGTPGGPVPSTPYFLTASTGFLAQSGGIYRTTDGGRSWQKVYSLPAGLTPLGGNLAAGPTTFVNQGLGYAALNIPNCWAGGCPDVIVRTEDGGFHWHPVSGEMQGPLPGLDAPETGPPGSINAIVGWGQGGVAVTTMLGLSVSQDGGVRWSPAASQQITMPGTYSILSYTPGAGVLAAGNAYLVQLQPAGGLRALWPPPFPTAQVDFLGPRQGFGVELQPELLLLRTDDGGRTWHRLPLRTGPALPGAISFADALHGWLFTPNPAILATTDGGRTWQAIRKGNTVGGQLFPGGGGVLVTPPNASSASPGLATTADGGRHFVQRTLPKGFPWGGVVRFASPRVGFAATPAALWLTVDGGRKWRSVKMPAGLVDAVQISALSADTHGDLWLMAALRNRTSAREAMYIRLQSGAWQEIRLPFAAAQYEAMESLDAISRNEAWLLTPAGLFQTTDGGRVWRNLTWSRPL
ncbi:MAG: YCF48-related protein [Thermaerobacter sp.]|nr:YCF48-related protein [Thermaerobacter sp.]